MRDPNRNSQIRQFMFRISQSGQIKSIHARFARNHNNKPARARNIHINQFTFKSKSVLAEIIPIIPYQQESITASTQQFKSIRNKNNLIDLARMFSISCVLIKTWHVPQHEIRFVLIEIKFLMIMTRLEPSDFTFTQVDFVGLSLHFHV